jgi:NADH-quinone oxidoreductase subunit N
VGVIASLISAYYYLRVVVVMYMREGEPVVTQDPWLRLVAYGSAIGVVLLGIFSSPLLSLASRAILLLF